MPKTTSNILLKIGLDENRIPESIHWKADESNETFKEAKAMLLSLWSPEDKESLKIDLWTKDMPLEDMKMFFYQTLLSMTDTFLKSTGDKKMTDTMRDFCDYFSEKLELKGKP